MYVKRVHIAGLQPSVARLNNPGGNFVFRAQLNSVPAPVMCAG